MPTDINVSQTHLAHTLKLDPTRFPLTSLSTVVDRAMTLDLRLSADLSAGQSAGVSPRCQCGASAGLPVYFMARAAKIKMVSLFESVVVCVSVMAGPGVSVVLRVPGDVSMGWKLIVRSSREESQCEVHGWSSTELLEKNSSYMHECY